MEIGVSVAVLLVAAQVCLSLAVRTRRVHNYLGARLESAFGRPVQVKHFNLEILPSPRIYATGVTVGEDPAFGYEYFSACRAPHRGIALVWFSARAVRIWNLVAGPTERDVGQKP